MYCSRAESFGLDGLKLRSPGRPGRICVASPGSLVVSRPPFPGTHLDTCDPQKQNAQPQKSAASRLCAQPGKNKRVGGSLPSAEELFRSHFAGVSVQQQDRSCQRASQPSRAMSAGPTWPWAGGVTRSFDPGFGWNKNGPRVGGDPKLPLKSPRQVASANSGRLSPGYAKVALS